MIIHLLSSKPKNLKFPLISWLIRLFQWSKESHVGIYFPSSGLVFHSHFTTYEWKKHSDYIEEHQILETIELNISEERYCYLLSYIDFLLNKTEGKNKDYFKLLLGSLIPIFVRKITFNKILFSNFYKKLTVSMVCSVLASEILDVIGAPYDSGIDRKIPFNTYSTCDAIKMYKAAQKYNLPQGKK